jgi:hypothetical protein
MDAEEIAGYGKEREVLGEDPYAYVMGENKKRTLAALNRYQIEQGLLKTVLPMDGLFIANK